MHSAKVVVHKVKGYSSGEVVYLLGERICEPRKAAHLHPHGEVLALYVASGDVFWVRFAGKRRPPATNALGGAVESV